MDVISYYEQEQMCERLSDISACERTGDNTQRDRKYTKKSQTYFPSNGQEKLILNAITGVEYPWQVGSKDARRLFHVVDTTGTFDSQGRRMKPTATGFPNPNPNHCYYDSPQQFMTHRKMTVNPQLIERWQAAQQDFTPNHAM
jgi:hypothetical protein